MKTSKNSDYINKLQGKRVKECMEMFNLTGKYIAKELNYTPQHISYIINGKRNLTLEVAMSLADLFSKHSGYQEISVQIPPNSHECPYDDDGFIKTQTFETEKKIDYRYLLGEKDNMFVWDNFDPPTNQTTDYLFKEGIKALLHHYGYDMKINMCPDITCFQSIKPNGALNNIMCKAFFSQDFPNEIINVSTCETLQLTPGELYQLFQDFSSSILNILNRKFEQQRWEDNLKAHSAPDDDEKLRF